MKSLIAFQHFRHTHLFFHVRHLDRGFAPQLKRQTQIHFNSFVDQVLQSRHGLTGTLQDIHNSSRTV